MELLVFSTQIGIYVIMFLTLLAAVGVVMLPHIFHAALSLVSVLIGIAAVYIALQAEFMGVVQILLYVGAIMTLIIFAIMLTHRLGDKKILQTSGLAYPAFLGSFALFAVLVRLIFSTPWPAQNHALDPDAHATVLDIGIAMMGPYVFPFEVISVVLIAALIGAVILARKGES